MAASFFTVNFPDLFFQCRAVNIRLVSQASVISKPALLSSSFLRFGDVGDSKGIFRRRCFSLRLWEERRLRSWWIDDSLCCPESENKPESQYFRIQTLGTVSLMKREPVFIRFYLIKWTTLCSPSGTVWVSGSAVRVPGGMSSWFQSRTGTLTRVLSLVWPTFITGGFGSKTEELKSHHENHL